MAKLTLNAFVTLDGVMQAPGSPTEDRSNGFEHGGWLVPLFTPDMGLVIVDIFSRAGAFLIGRGTYDIFARHWPKVTDPADLVANRLNALPKYVASRSTSEFGWQGTQGVTDLGAELDAVRQDVDGELQVHGSPGLAQTLIKNGLVDEYRLFVCPIVLGSGKRLFESLDNPAGLSLVGARSLGSGIVYSVYRPTSEFRTGSFGFE